MERHPIDMSLIVEAYRLELERLTHELIMTKAFVTQLNNELREYREKDKLEQKANEDSQG